MTSYRGRSAPVQAFFQLARGEVSTTIGGVYAFADVAEAHRRSDGGHAGGKVVLVP